MRKTFHAMVSEINREDGTIYLTVSVTSLNVTRTYEMEFESIEDWLIALRNTVNKITVEGPTERIQ